MLKLKYFEYFRMVWEFEISSNKELCFNKYENYDYQWFSDVQM